ncbi:hypothetical protein [Streptomyces nodosus]|uniref:ABC transporter permease n=1 Tax=Streptomyces nodosus TaxID=40318 RepID=A0A0B5DUE5_9ACTN|nr:hypothetical protein [Streptomyces nodosus]AJE44311.1 hypothetical protein SNOD_33260 [Streptomyces nodosus]
MRMQTPFRPGSAPGAVAVGRARRMTAEWIIGGQGLGKLVITAALSLETTTMWAAILASSLVAGLLFSLVTLAERLLLPWAERR